MTHRGEPLDKGKKVPTPGYKGRHRKTKDQKTNEQTKKPPTPGNYQGMHRA